ncbi:hypothetical protein BC830DRAFT_573789 [Chytriomyces sp. MP71]|nr:hypothetical protein BC830DRAFT_573789 [Chytriomyces sp. MP71]
MSFDKLRSTSIHPQLWKSVELPQPQESTQPSLLLILPVICICAQVYVYTIMTMCYLGSASLLDPLTLYSFVDANLLLVCTAFGYMAVKGGSCRGILLFCIYCCIRSIVNVSVNAVFAAWSLEGEDSFRVFHHAFALIVDPIVTSVVVAGLVVERHIAFVKAEVEKVLSEL